MVEKRVARVVHRVAEVFEKRDEVDVDDVVGLGLRKLDLLVHLDVLGGEVGLVNHAWPTVEAVVLEKCRLRKEALSCWARQPMRFCSMK